MWLSVGLCCIFNSLNELSFAKKMRWRVIIIFLGQLMDVALKLMHEIIIKCWLYIYDTSRSLNNNPA